MRSFKICPAAFVPVVGRCRTPSGRFSGGNVVSSIFLTSSLMSLVACGLEPFAYTVRREHLKCSGWDRHLRIGHGENIDIFEKLIIVTQTRRGSPIT